jgi:hypothetical protein
MKSEETRTCVILHIVFTWVMLTAASAAAQLCDPWILIPPNAGDPPDRNGHAMVYDTLTNQAIMFSGYYNPGSDSTTWFYNNAGWSNSTASPSPSGRAALAMVYDSTRSRVVMFGGENPNDIGVNETWEFDPSAPTNAWALRSTAGPAPRSNHAMAYDSRRCRTVLFGGQNTTTLAILNDTWEWDGNAWQQRFPANSPPPGAPFGQMVYDPERGVTVMLPDRSSIAATDNTVWEWDGSDWTARTIPNTPQRGLAGMTYDNRRKVVTLYGGGRGTVSFNDVWDYNGHAWTQHTSPAGPNVRRIPAVAYNPDIDRTVLFGGSGGPFPYTLGDTWEHDDKYPAVFEQPESTHSPQGGTAVLSLVPVDATAFAWRRNGVPLLDSFKYSGVNTPILNIHNFTQSGVHPGTYDCVVANDCGQVISRPVTAAFSACHPTWSLDLNTEWIPRAGHAQAYNAQANQTIFHGGRTSNNTTLGDAWTFNGSTWNPVFTPPALAPRFNHVMATHQASGSTILHGGRDSNNTVFNDVWLWSGASWTQLSSGPAGLHSAAMCYDSIRQKVVMFGGTDNTTISAVTYEWEPVNGWSAVFAPGLKGRYAHSMAFDPSSGHIVMHGGFDGTNVSDETWEFNGTNWRLRSTEGPPPAADMAMAYDQRLGAVVIAGDFTGAGTGQTWKWDHNGARWIELTDTNAPARRDHAMSYHAATQEMISTNGVETPLGTFVSIAASMSPPAVPDITQIIANPTTIKVNIPFTLSAVATGSNLSYQWFKNSLPLIATPNISGVSGPVLSFNSAVMANSGTYTCVVSSPCGSDSLNAVVTVLCLADVNNDGLVTPTDFTAWINAFNNNLSGCDQNCDGNCTPTDFTAWIANYNAGCP